MNVRYTDQGKYVGSRIAIQNLFHIVDAGEIGQVRVAATIAGFHAGIPRSPVASSFGSHREIEAAAIENFEELERVVSGPDQLGVLERLSAWTRAESARIGPILEERKRRGFVRECHGDLHLGNIYFDGFRPVLFDCIEFNAGLRWIDVVSEVAFLVMDLRAHGLDAQAWRLRNAYSEITADYQGLRVFNYYYVYQRLKNMVIDIIESGHTALVDAAFLWRAPRDGFYELARDLGVPHIILSCNASRDELRRRVADREASMNDASEAGVAVLENQIVTEEPLAPDELAYARFVDTDGDQATQLARVREIAASLG